MLLVNPPPASPGDGGRSATQRPTLRGAGKLGGSTRGAEHDGVSVLLLSGLLLPDSVDRTVGAGVF